MSFRKAGYTASKSIALFGWLPIPTFCSNCGQTPSWDCIEGFQTTAQDYQENAQEESLLISLEDRKSGIAAVLFNKEELSIVTRERVEVR